MQNKPFIPEHINITAEDLSGNNGIGRYIFLPGSDGRAHDIANHFDNLIIKPHPRTTNVYLGTIPCHGKNIDVASVSTRMGCPSTEIILYELLRLGGKRFLRVGTSGSMQPYVKSGSLINVQASVRDENTSTNYLPVEVPALASLEFVHAIQQAAIKLNLEEKIFTGPVHCKSSLYAREFGAGPEGEQNKAYMNLLENAGILATEMETSVLFVMSAIEDNQLKQQGTGPNYRVLAGAVLAAVSDYHTFDHSKKPNITIRYNITLAIEAIKQLAAIELKM